MSTVKGLLFGGFLTLVLTTSVMAAPADLGDAAVVKAFIDGVVTPLMKNNNSPSGTVAIAKDGQLIYAGGYGFQNIEKQIAVDPYTTLFRPGSVSKLATWVSVMQLVEQGKLNLDEDVNNYLQTFKIKKTFEKPVTLRDILTHSAGFEDGGMGYLIIADPDRAMPLRDAMERYQPMRVNPPGAQTAYSNYATALAGLIVSNISGLSFPDYIQQNIFDPLGMTSSSFKEPLPAALAENMAVSYAVEAGGFVEKPFEIVANFAPAGAQSATATDMVKFAQAILNGGELNGQRILRKDTVDEMLTRSFSHDERLMGMALGFYESDYSGYRVMGHGGDTQWFHSYLGIDQANGLTFFASFGGPGGSTVRSSLFDAFYAHFLSREEAPPVPPEDFSERAGKYAGSYGFWRTNFSTIEKALRVTSGIQVIPTEDNTLIVNFAGKSKQYAEVGDRLFREMNSNISIVAGLSPRLLAFQENSEGEVTGFVMEGLPFMSLRKLPFYETPNFNSTLLGLSMLIFLFVLMRRFFQRKEVKTYSAADQSAIAASVYAAGANLLVVASGIIVMSSVMDSLFTEIPLIFKLWLVLPIVATLTGIYQLYCAVGVWRQGLLAGNWARIRYTFSMLCALFMCWFYYFWNILGYQYL